MDTTVIISSGEAIDDAITNLDGLLGEIDAIDVVANKIPGDEGLTAMQMNTADEKILEIKSSMHTLVENTINFLTMWQNDLEDVDEVATENIGQLDGDE